MYSLALLKVVYPHLYYRSVCCVVVWNAGNQLNTILCKNCDQLLQYIESCLADGQADWTSMLAESTGNDPVRQALKILSKMASSRTLDEFERELKDLDRCYPLQSLTGPTNAIRRQLRGTIITSIILLIGVAFISLIFFDKKVKRFVHTCCLALYNIYIISRDCISHNDASEKC